MRKWFYIGRLRRSGGAIYVHWSLLCVAAVVFAAAIQSPAYALVALGSLVAVVVIHELGHAVVAHRLGYQVEAIRLALLHGRCEYDAPETAWEESLVAWGGVAAQVAVAGPIVLVDTVLARDLGILSPAIMILGYWSLFIGAINLLPWRELDGHLAWRIVPLLLERRRSRRVAKVVSRGRRGKRAI